MSDENKAIRKFQKELNAGAVSLVLLSVMKRHGKPMYGYEISKGLASDDCEEATMNQAAVYPVLRSLEKQGLLDSDLVPSDAGPARRYYRLTSEGMRTLSRWTVIWNETKHFVDSKLEQADAGTTGGTGDEVSREAGTVREAKGRRGS